MLLLDMRAESAAERDARLSWWREGRFGLFVHWGPVSLKGTEIGWSRGREVPVGVYDQLYQQFNPTQFDAQEWVALAKAAGAKYLVLTSKHHDGFCLWDSQQTDYDITSTPFHRDVVKELSDACRAMDVTFCLYHSIADWHHPDYLPRGAGDRRPESEAHFDRYVNYLKAQLRELLTGYGPLGVLWFDGEWERAWTHEHALDLHAYLRALQPSLIINNRIDKGRHDMEGTNAPGDFLGDFDTPEQRVGNFQNTRPWESCITLCQQWAWKPDDRMKSLQECLQTLVSCAGGDGNLLLNVGPMPDGQIEPRQAARLREIGTWLAQYGRTIYGTRGGPFKPGRWGASTYRGNTIFVHIFGDGVQELTLPPIAIRVVDCKSLSSGTAAVKQSRNNIELRLSAHSAQGVSITVIELTLDGPASEIQPAAVLP